MLLSDATLHISLLMSYKKLLLRVLSNEKNMPNFILK